MNQSQKSASKGKHSRIKDTGIFSAEEDDDDIMSTIASNPPPSKKIKQTLTTSATHISLNDTSSNQRKKVKSFLQPSIPIDHAVSKRASLAPIAAPIPIGSNGIPLVHIVPTIPIVQVVSADAPYLSPVVHAVLDKGSDAIALQNLLITLQTQQAQIETLTQRVAQVGSNQVVNRDARFIIIGKDGTSKHMIDEIFGRNYIKWSLNVIKFRFTDKELIENTLVPTDRSRRGHLNVEAVALLREALMVKYSFEAERFDKIWSGVKQAVNNKGRNLALKIRTRAVLAQARNRVTGIVRSISNMSINSNQE